MRIEQLRKEPRGDRLRVCATLVWEVSHKPSFDLFFETTAAFAEDLTLDPNAFVLASVLPAMAHGERRVLVDGPICPELKENLMVATEWVRRWFGPPRQSISVETTHGTDYRSPERPARAGSFMSGGIDSLATLRDNRLKYPLDHPRSIKDCLVLHGFDIGCFEHGEREYAIFDRTMEGISQIARETGVSLIPVYTNARHLHDDGPRFIMEYHGAVLAAAGHVFSNRLTSVAISASMSYDDYVPWGSHPLLDPNYSSTGLQVMHVGFQYSRLEKVKVVADWPAGLTGIRVCIRNRTDKVNCGECYKCIRTMLELYAIGRYDDAVTFPPGDIRTEQILKLRPGIFRYHSHYFFELYPYLRQLGRTDLVRAIEKRRRWYTTIYAWAEWLGLVKYVKHLDKQHFDSVITRLLGRLV